MFALARFELLLSLLPLSLSKPTQHPYNSKSRYFDVQVMWTSVWTLIYIDSIIPTKRVIEGVEEKWSKILYRHLHGGLKVELTQYFFSDMTLRGLILGATTLELDNGITKVDIFAIPSRISYLTLDTIQDGVVVVWHDNEIRAEKCIDTKPVVIISLSLREISNPIDVHNLDWKWFRFPLCWQGHCQPHFGSNQNSGLRFEAFDWFSWVFYFLALRLSTGDSIYTEHSQLSNWPIRGQKYLLFAKSLNLQGVPILNVRSHGTLSRKSIPFCRVKLEEWPILSVHNTKSSSIACTAYRKLLYVIFY